MFTTTRSFFQTDARISSHMALTHDIETSLEVVKLRQLTVASRESAYNSFI